MEFESGGREMSIRLSNEPERVYEGNIWEQLQRIRTDGRVVAPTAYFMLERLERRQLGTYYHVGDFIAENPRGEYKLVLDAFSHPDFMNWGKMSKGEFVLRDGVYETLPGVVFTNRARINRNYALEETLASREWHVLARRRDFSGEKEWAASLLEQYCRRVVFPEHEQAMGIYLSDASKASRLRAVCVNRLVGRSQFYGRCYLDYDYGRLVGLAPEALEAARMRSFEVCERLSQEPYPILVRERIQKTTDSRLNAERKRVEITSRDPGAIEIERADEKHISLSLLKEKFNKLEQGGKYRGLDEIKKILLSGDEHE